MVNVGKYTIHGCYGYEYDCGGDSQWMREYPKQMRSDIVDIKIYLLQGGGCDDEAVQKVLKRKGILRGIVLKEGW